jgi:hypothetical protein
MAAVEAALLAMAEFHLTAQAEVLAGLALEMAVRGAG